MPNKINKKYEARHLANFRQQQQEIKSWYEQIIDRVFSQTGYINLKSDTFKLEDYPILQQAVNGAMQDLHSGLMTILVNGIGSSWDLSQEKNAEIASSTYKGIKIDDSLQNALENKRTDALNQFIQRKTKGLNLSDRVWRYTNQFQGEVEQALYVGISSGTSATKMAADMKRYLQQPDKLFRRVRNSKGKLVLSKAARQYSQNGKGPGRGVYRSSFKNALRVSRNENNFAYRTADVQRWQAMPFVLGYEVKLSNNHPRYDVCDSLAGRYPVSFVFKGWHISCICYSVPILADRDQFAAYNQALMEGTEEDFVFSGRITDVPPGYKAWMQDQGKDIATGRITPLWAKDNYKNGDVAKGLKFSTDAQPEPQKQAVDLNALIKGKKPTNNEVSMVLKAYAERFPENFRNGLGEIKFKSSNSFMMQHSMSYKPSTGEWVGPSSITLSTHTYASVGMNAAEEFKAALAAIKAGAELTFKQEYAVESLWHEILHAKTKTPPRNLTQAEVKAMETVNQFIARHTYDQFLEALGGKANNKAKIIDEGYGYASWIKAFRADLRDYEIPEEIAVKELLPVLMGDYKKIPLEVLKFIERNKK